MQHGFHKEEALFIFCLTIIVGLLLFNVRVYSDFFAESFFKPEIYKNVAAVFSIKEKPPEVLTFAFVGDIMLDRQVETRIMQEGGGDFKFPFLYIAEDLKSYDFLFGNLEGAMSSRGKNVGSIYSFRMDPQAMDGLIFAGFDALSVANNHSGDWGYEAFSDTVSILRSGGIAPVGVTREPEYIEVGDLKLGLLAFSDFPNPGQRIEEENIKNSVSEAAGNSDFVIVSFHFGEEYQTEQSTRQKKYAELAVDHGADIVVGHHPHVSQPLEKYRDSYIAYSLGNFIFDQYFSEETMKGSLLEVDIENGKIIKANLRDIVLNRNYQPSFVDPSI